MEKLVLEHARVFMPSEDRVDLPVGRIGHCFSNALAAAEYDAEPEFVCVEEFATASDSIGW